MRVSGFLEMGTALLYNCVALGAQSRALTSVRLRWRVPDAPRGVARVLRSGKNTSSLLETISAMLCFLKPSFLTLT